jgi:hypothetical protein
MADGPAGGGSGQGEEEVEGLAAAAAHRKQEGEWRPLVGHGDRVEGPVVGGCAHGAVLLLVVGRKDWLSASLSNDPKDRHR